jgi:hypothetical protein
MRGCDFASPKTKIGDIFSVTLDSNSKKFFQYVANDLIQLNSDVIRVFKKTYSIAANPDTSEIVKDEVDFYAHCVLKWGVKLGMWKKVGSIAEIGNLEVLFRDTNDYGRKIDELPTKISDKWYVWRIGDTNFTRVGKLQGVNKKAEIGIVVAPQNIAHRMQTGDYLFSYPE